MQHGGHLDVQLAAGASKRGALTSGYQLALGTGAAICPLGALAAAALLRNRPPVASAEEASEPRAVRSAA